MSETKQVYLEEGKQTKIILGSRDVTFVLLITSIGKSSRSSGIMKESLPLRIECTDWESANKSSNRAPSQLSVQKLICSPCK